MPYRIHGLPLDSFRELFALSDVELKARGARRMVADAPNSAPCRVSLTDAEPGDRLILLTHRHLDAPSSPYRSEGPIFVREAATQADLSTGRAPDMHTRLPHHSLIQHLHTARRGCFMAAATRA